MGLALSKSKVTFRKLASKKGSRFGMLLMASLLVLTILSFTTVSELKENVEIQSTDTAVSTLSVLNEKTTEEQTTSLNLESNQHYIHGVLDSIPEHSKIPYEQLRSKADTKRPSDSKKGGEGIKISSIDFGEAKSTTGIPKTSQRIQLNQLRKSATSTLVDFQVENSGEGNPYKVNYSYEMNKTSNGDTQIELKAFLDPLDLYFDESLKFSGDGQMVTMPKDLSVGQNLTDVSGTFTLKIPNVSSFNKKYEVTLTNRKITEEGMKTVNGQQYKAFKHTYYYTNKSFFNGDLECTKYHKVTEWYIESIGLIEQQRSGTNERSDRIELVKNTSRF